jgi:hypothetical protein
MTRFFAGTACGASPVSVAMRARRRTKASAGAALYGTDRALPRARFLLEVKASQAILSRDQAPPDDS